MKMNKQLNNQLLQQREYNIVHVGYEEEYNLYHAIACGDLETVNRYAQEYKRPNADGNANNGILSKNPLQNTKYHFVVFTALITRLCVEHGLEREKAYTLSDLYINAMDVLTSSSAVIHLQGDMLLDFTEQMRNMEKKTVYSIQISRAMDYIYQNLQKRLTTTDIAIALDVNSSYLSHLFKKETGLGINQFVRQKKVHAAANMLKFSKYSYAEISEYFCFSSQSHFIQCFKQEMGCTPKEYRKKYFHFGLEI